MTKRSPLTVEEQVAKHREYMHCYNQNKRSDVFRKTDAVYHYRYRKLNRDRCIEYERRWRAAHPGVNACNNAKRRALQREAEGGFTPEEFRLKCEAYENRCVYCNEEVSLTIDHVIPLSRGGSNSIENIVPACNHCNSTKGTKTYSEFLEYIRPS